MPFLLMVFLTLACLPDIESYAPPGWIRSPERAVLWTCLVVLLLGLWAAVASWKVCRRLRLYPDERQSVLGRYDRIRRVHGIALLVGYTLVIALGGWGWAVGSLWRWGTGELLPLPELLILLPFLASLVLSWACWFDADRACSRAAYQALGGDSTAASILNAGALDHTLLSSRGHYLLFQLRHKLALVCVPLVLLLAQKEMRRQLPQAWQAWQGAVHLVSLGVVLGTFVLMPWLVRILLGLRPLPEGPLRTRLTATARRMGFRCSDVLVWNTRQGMANAMVIGIIPWLRYVIFTDRLLSEFTAEEVEAVFGHEIGHVRHHHMLYYLVFLLVSMVVLGMAVAQLLSLAGPMIPPDAPPLSPEVLQGDPSAVIPGSYQYLEIIPMVLVLLLYVFVVFGFLSRRCERQADIQGCRAVSCGGPDCTGLPHEESAVLSASGLCPAGIQTFIGALEKVASINGISRDRPGFFQSWQHSTIAHRVRFLQGLLLDPGTEAAFQRRLFLIKCGFFLLLGAGFVLLLASNGWQP